VLFVAIRFFRLLLLLLLLAPLLITGLLTLHVFGVLLVPIGHDHLHFG
jgi:hypothetical protein